MVFGAHKRTTHLQDFLCGLVQGNTCDIKALVAYLESSKTTSGAELERREGQSVIFQ